MFVFPTYHTELTVRKLPFATFALIALNLLVYLLVIAFSSNDEEALDAATDRVVDYHNEHDYLELPRDLVKALPPLEQTLYNLKVEWLGWFADDEDGVRAHIEKLLSNSSQQQIASQEQLAIATLQRSSDDKITQSDERSGAFTKIKNAFLLRVSMVDNDRWEAEQAQLDQLVDTWRGSLGSSLEHKLGFVPAHPSILGLLAHSFVNTSVIQLILSMIILWIAGAKLEDVWSWPVLVGGYVVFGVCSALVHAALTSDAFSPVMGSTGAVAGLMGAFTVRLARSKINFAYFLWITLKPRMGTFEAPAVVLIPTWLLAELGIWTTTGGMDIGFQIWPYIGGAVAGVLAALVLKLADFERKVLKRDPEEEKEPDPDSHPLVAFQSVDATRPAPPPVSRPIIVFREWTAEGFDGESLQLMGPGEELMILDSNSVEAIAAARIDKIDGPLAREWFTSGRPPKEHAVIVALLHADGAGNRRVSLLDASKLKYATFTDRLEDTPRANFFAFLRRVARTFPDATLVGPRNIIAEENLPVHAGLEGFLSSIQGAIINRQDSRQRKG